MTKKKTKKQARPAKRRSFLASLPRHRTKKEQQTLVREIASVFCFTFGLMCLVGMYKTPGEAGYGIRQFLLGTVGQGGWFMSLISFYVGLMLLFPAKFWQRTNRIFWTVLIGVCLLGLMELPVAQTHASFAIEATHGGRIGFYFDKVLLFFGAFLAAVIQIALIFTSILILTDASLTKIVDSLGEIGYRLRDAFQDFRASTRDIRLEREERASRYDRDEPEEMDEPDETAPTFTTQQIAGEETSTSAEVDISKYRDLGFTARPIHGDNDTSEDEETPRKHKNSVWFLPPLDLLDPPAKTQVAQGDPEKRARIIENTLMSFGVEVRVVEINVGPTITQYALEPAVGTRVAKITALQNDLALAMATSHVRIEAPIPGKPLVGIEVPNYNAATVTLRALLQTPQFQTTKMNMPLALGKNVSGEVFIADLMRMPHLLVAGSTGSGKSVCINSIISSILYKYNPDQVKFIMVDPKVVELSRYNGIPHLLTKVITQPGNMISSLKWAINEMERRYKIFANAGARNLELYNEKQDDAATRLPYIVIIVDELADLILASPVEVEENICRLAQKSRATGIHLVLATQRPSVDVVTGLIKANIPTRICFAVASQIDSRVVLDAPGGEKLLGRGDMLYHAPDMAKMTRLQGVYVSDLEVERLVEYWTKQGSPDYIEEVLSQPIDMPGSGGGMDMEDELLPDALAELLKEGRGSASLLQRRLRIGYARAARIIDILEQMGVLGPADGSKPRDVLRSSLPSVQPTASRAAPHPQPYSDDESLFDEYQN